MTVDSEKGPVYGVPLLDTLPLSGGMMQQMPGREELEDVRRTSERVVAAYEVLVHHYREEQNKVYMLKCLLADVIAGKWSVTVLQEAINGI